MGKRGNNEGTITRRADGRWEARISLPDSKRKSFYGKTRQEVAQRLSQARNDVDRGLPLPDERQTVGQYLTSWLEVVCNQIKPSSFRIYCDLTRIHLIPALGKTPLARLTAQQVQEFYSQKIRAGLSTTTVHHLHGVLHRALKDAFRLGLVQRNVTEMVKAPRRAQIEMQVLSEEQAQCFLKGTTTDRFHALYVLALTTGMRQGELLALRWRDVDLDHRRLRVRTTLQRQVRGGAYAIAEPKTACSRRTIALSQAAVAALREHRIRQAEERLLLGPAWDASLDLIFPTSIGTILMPHVLLERFKALLKQAGLPSIRFHDLRHSAATIAIARGVNIKVVSEMLGHTSVTITLQIYAHVTPDMQQAAADVMDAIFLQGFWPPDLSTRVDSR
jgi:integrase